jgi:DNA-binding HxlR family transcriptional regulator
MALQRQEGTFMSPGHTEGTTPPTMPTTCPSGGGPGPTACPAVREVLDRVGDKWSVLVIANLGGGPRRFSELRRGIEGVSQRMLTLTVRGLERDGLVRRTQYETIPPKVEYALTPLGETLLEPIRALAMWAAQNRTDIQQARARFDARGTASDAAAEEARGSMP